MKILIAIVLLNLLIGVHELGHFLAAKWCGLEVEEFSLGMGPKIISKKLGGTVYSIRWILLGGYVKLNEEAFPRASWIKQVFVIINGVMFNLIFALICVWIYIGLSTDINVGVVTGFFLGIEITFRMIIVILSILMDLFRTADTSAFSGPVGIVSEIGVYVEKGIRDIVEICSVLNLNLFVMNLLPIPMLDGGQVILITIKKIFKKESMPKFETVWNIIGLIIVGGIFFFALKNDFFNIIR